MAQANLVLAGSDAEVAEVVADKGYHDNGLLAWCAAGAVRTYIPERAQKSRRWTDKPAEYEEAFRGNRRRADAAGGAGVQVPGLLGDGGGVPPGGGDVQPKRALSTTARAGGQVRAGNAAVAALSARGGLQPAPGSADTAPSDPGR